MKCVNCPRQATDKCQDCGKYFCGQLCFNMICGQFQDLQSLPTFNRDTFVHMLSVYGDDTDAKWSFLDAFILDATEAQRKRIFAWIYDDKDTRVRKELRIQGNTTWYLLNWSTSNIVANIPLSELSMIDQSSFGALLKNIIIFEQPDMLRVIVKRFELSEDELIWYGFRYVSDANDPKTMIEKLKILGSLLNENGRRIAKPFIRSIMAMDTLVHEQDNTNQFTRFKKGILQALEYSLDNAKEPIMGGEMEREPKKIKI